jgi:hypothetical protein
MSGLTFYETLRILVPGSIAVFLLDVTLRVGFGTNPLRPDGGVRPIVSVLESPIASLIAALILGMLLYLVDLPSRTRLFTEGDPARQRRLPSDTLATHLAGTPWSQYPVNLGLYFLVSDKYLPAEFHRRVYLFGSLYRVFVDLRALSILTVVVGVASSAAVGAQATGFDPTLPLNSRATAAVLAVVGAMLLAALPGLTSYGANVAAKHDLHELWRRLRIEIRGISGLFVLVLSLGALASICMLQRPIALIFLGTGLASAQVVIWTWVELGPPNPPTRRADIRSITLARLGARRNDVQYGPLQRLAGDVGLATPWLVTSTVLHANQGGGVLGVLCWGAMAVVATTIMSVRKHEVRLLASYENQSVWLDLHAVELANLRQTGRLPDRWR